MVLARQLIGRSRFRYTNGMHERAKVLLYSVDLFAESSGATIWTLFTFLKP